MSVTINKYILNIKADETTDTIVFGKSSKSNIMDKAITTKDNETKWRPDAMLSVRKCDFDLKMFASGHIVIDMTLDLMGGVQYWINEHGMTLANIQDTFQGAKVALKYNYDRDGKAAECNVATDFFIYKVNASCSSTYHSTVFLSLDVYSMDKLLDMQPMTRAYTSQKLSAIINDFKTNLNSAMGSKTGIEKKLQLDTYNCLNVIRHNFSTNGVVKELELILPYLVQYNESFYSFLRRVCARMGEFLYFENGRLVYGLNTLNKVALNDYLAGYKSVSSAVNTDKFNAFNVEDWHRNSHSNKETFATSKYVSENHVGNDEFLQPLSVTKDNEFILKELIPKVFTVGYVGAFGHPKQNSAYMIREVFELLRLTAFSFGWKSVLKNVLPELLWQYPYSQLELARNSNKKAYWLNMLPEKDGKNYNYKKEEQNDKQMISHFSTVDSRVKNSENMTNANLGELTESLYSKISKSARLADEKRVGIDLDNYATEVKLGTIVTFPEGGTADYLVTAITGTVEVNNAEVVTCRRQITVIPKAKVDSHDLWLPVPAGDVIVRAQGPQTGFVTDSHDPYNQARVRVRMSWQNTSDKDATPWVRVAMPMAGESGYMFVQPSVGDEVLVDFENGNMERPYVRGSLFNGKNQPLHLGFNSHIRSKYSESPARYFQSGMGSGLYIQDEMYRFTDAIKTFSPLIGNALSFIPIPKVHETDVDNSVPLGANISLRDFMGFYSINMSSKNRSVDISSPLGTVSINAFTGISIDAPNGDIRISGKNVDISACNRLTLHSGTNILGPIPEYSGRGWIARVICAIAEKAMGKVLGDKVLDLSLIRSFVEIFLRPVNGTLTVKSNRHLVLEAGKGAAEIPYDSIKASATVRCRNIVNSGYPYFLMRSVFMDIENQEDLLNKAAVEAYNAVVRFVKNNVRQKNENIDKEDARDIKDNDFLSFDEGEKFKLSVDKCKQIFDLVKVKDKDGKYEYDITSDYRRKFCPVPESYLHSRLVVHDRIMFQKTAKILKHDSEWVKKWLAKVDEFGTLICNYYNAIRGNNLRITEAIEAYLDSQAAAKVVNHNPKVGRAFSLLLTKAKANNADTISLFYNVNGTLKKIEKLTSDNFTVDLREAQVSEYSKYKDFKIRYFFIYALWEAHIISYIGDQEPLSDGTYEKNEKLLEYSIAKHNWNGFVSKLVPYFDDAKKIGFEEFMKTEGSNILDTAIDFDNLKAFGVMKAEHGMWDATSNPGSIVMSDSKGTMTTRLDGNGQFMPYENASLESFLEALKDRDKLEGIEEENEVDEEDED